MAAMEYGHFITFLHLLLMFLELNALQNYKGDPTQHKNWPLLNLGTSCGRRIWEYSGLNMTRLQSDTRILGGTTAEKNEFPWLVNVIRIAVINDSYNEEYSCGGSVINHRYVLTVAHCCADPDPLAIRTDHIIYLSDDNVKYPNQFVKRVEKVTIHEKYDDDGVKNDICLVRLEEPLEFSASIQPICLPVEREWETKDLTGDMVTVVGWGVTHQDPSVFPKSLQKVSLPVVSIDGCIKQWNEYKKEPMEVNPQSQLCAGNSRKDACKGDSGGPYMYQSVNNTNGVPRYLIIGLVSFGLECTKDKKIGARRICESIPLYSLDIR